MIHARKLVLLSWLSLAAIVVAATALIALPWIGPGVGASAAWAADDSDDKPSQTELTTPLIKELEAKLAEVSTRSALPAAAREQLAADYRVAIEARRRAEHFRLKREYVDRLLDDAPGKKAALEAELDTPSDPVDPNITNGAELPQVTARIAQLESDLATQRIAQEKLEGEIAHRAERRTTLPREGSEAKLKADALRERLSTIPEGGTDKERALRSRLSAELAENEAKAELHTQELFSYDGRRDLLATRRDVAIARVSYLKAELAVWRQALAVQREAAGEEAARVADAAREAATTVHPALRALAAEVAALAAERAADGGLSSRLTAVEEKLAVARARGPALRKRFDGIRTKAAIVGYSNAIGALLRKEKQNLPQFSPSSARARQAAIAETQFRMIELEEQRRGVGSVAAAVDEIVASTSGSLGTDTAQVEHVAFVTTARDLVSKKREYLDGLINSYDKYFLALVELDGAQTELVQDAARYERYIDEHVLWIRNAKPLWPTVIPDAVEAALWLAHPRGWAEVAASFYRIATQQPGFLALATSMLALLFYCQGRLRRFVRARGKRARTPGDERAIDAVAILAASLLVAFAWPALMNVASYVMLAGHDERAPNLIVALAKALSQVAAVLFSFEFLRQLCRKGGLAETHLGWSRARIEAIRRHAAWALPTGIAAVLITLLFEGHGEADWQNSLGRIAFITSMGVLTVFAHRALMPAPSALSVQAPSLPLMTAGLVRLAGVGGPIVFALLAASGWYFSALQLAANVPATNWLIVGIAVADRLILRWLRLAELNLRREQARTQLAEARKREERKSGEGLVEHTDAMEELPDVAAVSAQTRQLVRAVLGTVAAVGLFAIWGDMLPAFRLLDRVELWTVRETLVVTLADLLVALGCFAGAALAARNIPGFLEIAVLQRLPLDAGVRYAARAISRYLIAITGTMFGFGALGLGWTDVQWLVAAMTVGLGFGLQEIFANFVSGIILLFERPIRVGDTVTLGTTTGTVSRIHTRATTITDFDRKELIVPNKEFITGQLINWSLSDNVLRVVINVGVAYGSDVQLTEAKLLETAKECPYVLVDPPPSVLFDAFGGSSLDFQLRVFIASFDDWLRTRHAMHKAIDAKFREAGIEISFPQRDLHLRSVDSPILVKVET